ncbi:MAG: hypothetical protein AAFX44_03350 [Pseudomonadota bacterium]
MLHPLKLCLACALVGAAITAAADTTAVEIGRLAHPDVTEASGLARSPQHDDRYWVINDSGNAPKLYAIDSKGKRHGTLAPRGVKNRDWEDLESFERDGKSYLLVADVGDNNGVRSEIRVYVIEEPAELPGAGKTMNVDVAWVVRLKYPGGGRDAESVAVADDSMYLMTKRTLPPALYRAPLRPLGDEVVELEWLGAVDSLPAPTVRELAEAPRTRRFGWQPTGMSFSADGRRAVVVSNWRAFIFERHDGQTWLDALNSEPRVVAMPPVDRAESVSFDSDEQGFLTTFEGRHAPLYRFALP